MDKIEHYIKEYLNNGTNRFMVEIECNISSYIKHIEKQFTKGMMWENIDVYWNISHIKPISEGGTFSYTNSYPKLK